MIQTQTVQTAWTCAVSGPQLRCDEKGFVAVCAFGLPGKTHDDGPVRGVLAALEIAHGMQASLS